MKKLLITALMVVIAWGAFAQMTVDASKIDLSRAHLSLAGPDAVYVTNIYYGNTRLSVLLKYDGKTGATIYGPYYDSDKFLLDSFNLGYATLRVQGNDTIIVSDLILYGQGVSGRLKYDGAATLNLTSWWETMTPETNEMRVADLQNQLQTSQKRYEQEIAATKQKYEGDVTELKQQNADLETQIAQMNRDIAAGIKRYESQITSLQRQLETAGVEVETTEMMPMSTRPTMVAMSGFGMGAGRSGNWTLSGGRLTQNDSTQYYAKYVISGNQSADQTLYSFTAQAASNSKPFTGYGIHFFASGDKAANSYGFGNSYLVWLTRDPSYYKTDDTYVQIYRSYDDIKMVQVSSVAIPDRITAANNIEVLYDRANSMITVAVNGKDVVSYHTPSPIRSGSKGAFRTLGGPVSFSNFQIKAK